MQPARSLATSALVLNTQHMQISTVLVEMFERYWICFETQLHWIRRPDVYVISYTVLLYVPKKSKTSYQNHKM